MHGASMHGASIGPFFFGNILSGKSSYIKAMRGPKFNHLAPNSTTPVAAEAGVNPALPATAFVEFMTKWSNLCPRTV